MTHKLQRRLMFVSAEVVLIKIFLKTIRTVRISREQHNQKCCVLNEINMYDFIYIRHIPNFTTETTKNLLRNIHFSLECMFLT